MCVAIRFARCLTQLARFPQSVNSKIRMPPIPCGRAGASLQFNLDCTIASIRFHTWTRTYMFTHAYVHTSACIPRPGSTPQPGLRSSFPLPGRGLHVADQSVVHRRVRQNRKGACVDGLARALSITTTTTTTLTTIYYYYFYYLCPPRPLTRHSPHALPISPALLSPPPPGRSK